ncbi:non-ribosomal peptide synthetase [Chamaesiphon minutus]|uniref:Amino acid adenylation enzyme/thioester reductase family protein n=1 Tax=Chamaesiphon minutus (strain ATCC 27169 / PCC 6605) TaxID=1173020 RepID=K9UHF6_CHAP6|nr:non-ribosomal peptide synthetase [Chamaesiphon minutus]AFY93866.1 amino acid adenylation enzyme/thioester reductase family protein [Chamaesiphon minutus PCC 6605]
MMDCLSERAAEIKITPASDLELLFAVLPPNLVVNSATDSKLLAIDFDPFADGELLLTAPATESQKEIWLGVQLSKEANLACMLSQSLRLAGRLNLDALQGAIEQLANRHESLRTTFSSDGMTISIAKVIKFQSPIIDLSDLTESARGLEIDRQQQLAVSEPFDLRHGPLFRTTILKLTDREHILIFTIHHIVCDGWSMGVIAADLAKFYTALNRGIEPAIGQAEYFSDYAFAERDDLGSPESLETAAYWLDRFADLPPILDLPTDYPRPPLRTFNSSCEHHTLSASLVDRLEKLGVQNRCSLMTTLLAAYEIFLFKLTGQTDLTVGIPTSGQIAAGKYNLVGHCVNFLPLRSRIAPESNFSTYLRSRNTEILDDYERQNFTFGSLLQKLPIPRDASRIPLVSAVFNIDLNPEDDRDAFDGLSREISFNRGSFATFEFFLNAVTTPQGHVKLECQYNTHLFSAATIQNRLQEFENLLAQIVADAERPLRQLSLLSAAQTHRLLVEWNQTETNYPHDRSIHELFEQQVAIAGDAVALVFEAQQLTYRQLNERANQLANYLIASGVKSGELVGIALDRSIETIVGILGILKAGGAYLPLDLSYPAERLAFMLADANVSVLLTKQTSIDRLPPHSARIVYVDTDWDKIATASGANPQQSVRASDVAQVMYTSGSTGRPKGVLMPHRGVVRLVKETNYLDFSPAQVWLQLAPISFDASSFEIWGSLLNGAKLVLFPGEKPTLGELGQIIARHQITTLWLTAGLFHVMVDERIEDLRPLRQLIAGGDVLSVPHVQKVLSMLPNCQLINGYGPTENTTFTCCHRVTSLARFNSIPIGRPIANTQVYILDLDRQPVPIGVPGELYIGGDGLAQGYLNRPDLTAEKFITNPFAGAGKLYRTGDLVRYLPDGEIEFLGRIDNQVKIRGFRIELGEIDAVLSQHPQVREVRVIDREDRPGDKRLVAYIVTHRAQPPTEDWRSFLLFRLPEYLVPSAFVTVDALPLTANGKVDRRALPTPDDDLQVSTEERVVPRDEIERQLAEIWERVLDVREIGIRDNFFELGGHSLMAVRLFAEVEKMWGQNLPLATLFQAQTIELLAKVLRQKEWVAPWSSLVAIEPSGSKTPIFCFHPIGGNVMEYYPLAEYLGKDRPIYGLQCQGLDGKQPLLNSIEEMASHYLQEILTVQPHGPYLLIGYSFGGLLVYEAAQQLTKLGKKVDLLAIVDCNAPHLPRVRPSFLKSIQIHLSYLWKLNLCEKIQYIKDRIDYRFNNVDYREFLLRSFPENVSPSTELLQLIDNNFNVDRAYIARPYHGDLTLFRCEMQILDYYLSPDLGWGDLVSGDLAVYNVAGSHYSILREPIVRSVAEKIEACLRKLPTSVTEQGNNLHVYE